MLQKLETTLNLVETWEDIHSNPIHVKPARLEVTAPKDRPNQHGINESRSYSDLYVLFVHLPS